MRLIDRLRNKNYDEIRRDLISEGFDLATADRDWTGTADDTAILLTRAAGSFVSGTVVYADAPDEPVDALQYYKFFHPNNWTSDSDLLKRFFWLYHRFGVGYLYFTPAGRWFLLENSNLRLDYKSDANIFKSEKFMDLLYGATYTHNGGDLDLIALGGEIVPIYDEGFSHNDFKPISRLERIAHTEELSKAALSGLIGALKRIHLMLLTPKSGEKGVASYSPNQGADGDVEAEGRKLRKTLSLKKGSVGILGRPMDVLNTNPDNGKLKALESLDKTAMNSSAMFGAPYKLFFGQTKFDDAALHLTYFYLETLQPVADKVMRAVNEKLKHKRALAISYDGTLDRLVSTSESAQGSTSTEPRNTNDNE